MPVTRVILSLKESPDLDSNALEARADFADGLQARNIELRVARPKEAVRQLLMLAALPRLPAAAPDYWSVKDATSGSDASAKPVENEC